MKQARWLTSNHTVPVKMGVPGAYLQSIYYWDLHHKRYIEQRPLYLSAISMGNILPQL